MNFKQFLENTGKTLILMRGVSGSGKSTVAKQLANRLGGTLFSTDDFFMKDGKYHFDQNLIAVNHQRNQARTEEAMSKGESPIIIDNTNSQAWEMKPYYELAQKYGYQIEIKQPGDQDFPEVGFDELMRRQSQRAGENKAMSPEMVKGMMGQYQPNVSLDDIKNSQPPTSP